eukprot:CAMPEP_0201623748 /NCGR_PEP_ID=MMETSP0493-20130528/120_1 /ASSEMBLY_ACC=CAM_ASM_000838 /TAXON_ID=420259 /ORGANISM="Thalassiosira gravida, Strain GMp14c1" /LENGTH=44 /DNA_ID= /DNA_START= /DNA_END= /DNA_ORIENTATION=
MASEGMWPDGNDDSAMVGEGETKVRIETAKGADDLGIAMVGDLV